MESMELLGAKQQAQQAQQADVGQVAAAKEAAVGTADRGAQQQAQQAGHRQLEARAQRDGAGPSGAAALAPQRTDADKAAAPPKEQQAVGAMGAQLQAVETVAQQQDAGASREQQQEEAERALREAEQKEGEGGNPWAKALAAAGVAASAAAVAVSATG